MLASSANWKNAGRPNLVRGHDGYARIELAEQMFLLGFTLKIRRLMRMASGDEYLQYAEQCLALAAKSANPADKARLLQMAQAWRDLVKKRDNGRNKDPAASAQ
jgi:hypothetical protein